MTPLSITRGDDPYNAFITRCEGMQPGKGRLAGIPIAVKDNISTRDIPTSCGSRILEGYTPPYNAHVVDLILREGAVMAGKTNMDEFGMGSSTENSAFGPTKNPVDPARVPGGSSGGSAAAVAAGLVPLALGTDTGGSIRCPAAFCGIVGFKPSYGRVSRYGLVAYANSLEQIGPFARTVKEAVTLMEVISRFDPRDNTMLPDRPFTPRLDGDVKGLRIGIPSEFFGAGVDTAVAAKVREAIGVLEGMGARVVPCSMPSMAYALAAYYVTCTSEASSNLARFDGIRYGPPDDIRKSWHDAFREVREKGFGEEVRRRILLGTFALSAGYYGRYYGKAQAARRNVSADFARIFREADVIAGPTMPTVAFRIGEKTDPLSMYLSDILTVPANLAGVPAVSVPCGKLQGLPVGLQVMGKPFADARVLEVAYAYEQGVRP